MRKTVSLALVLLNLTLPLLALEWAYRAQLLDTYRPELHALNPVPLLADDRRPTLLVMGDSFTAERTSYAGILQETFQEWRVINAAVSGTGVLQALYMAPHRFAQFHPTIFLYQVYVGNDLFDVRYPTNWHTISLGRNIYWFLANHLRVASYLNYRLRQRIGTSTSSLPPALSLGVTPAVAAAAVPTAAFTVEHYDARVKIYLRAEPSLLEDSILVQNHRRQDYAIFLARVEKLLAYCKPEVCRAYVLVMPHVCQVDEAYLAHMRQLGAHFTTPAALRLSDYPFLVGLREHFAAWPQVHIVNPLPTLREAVAQQAVYHTHDEHLNAAGQHALAAWLVRQLSLQ